MHTLTTQNPTPPKTHTRQHSLLKKISIMNNLGLPPPKKLDVAVPANLKCGLDD